MANTGVAPPNFTTDVGKVRVLLGDTDPTNVAAGSGTYMYFSDELALSSRCTETM